MEKDEVRSIIIRLDWPKFLLFVAFVVFITTLVIQFIIHPGGLRWVIRWYLERLL